MVELYKKNVWSDAKTVNIVVTACFSSTTKVMVAAIKFFLGKDEDADNQEDSSDSEDEVHLPLPCHALPLPCHTPAIPLPYPCHSPTIPLPRPYHSLPHPCHTPATPLPYPYHTPTILLPRPHLYKVSTHLTFSPTQKLLKDYYLQNVSARRHGRRKRRLRKL